MTELVTQTLHIVARELAASLHEARLALEAFEERPEDPEPLLRVGELLQQARGVLRVVEVYGAALLAEETAQTARFLAATPPERQRRLEGVDALMRAVVQLPTYLERVLAGGRDLALVLLPLLNDLRAVRGCGLLSEGTLLLLNLTSDRQPDPHAAIAGDAEQDRIEVVRKLRPRFQAALLGWIRDDYAKEHLAALEEIAQRLEKLATTQPLFQLWWVVGAVVEALRDGGLEAGATLKRLLGQADREIRRLCDIGEARFAENPPLDLLNNLLYYVARTHSGGPRVRAVRASFRLADLLPVDQAVEQERESLSAPSINLMKTVAAAIKEDLGRVKDALDLYTRQGGRPDELGPQVELLKKIGDTLAVLGLGPLRERVQREIERLRALTAEPAVAGRDALVEMAAALIAVEDGLDEDLVRLIMPPGASAPLEPQDPEFRQVAEAVLRECIVNLARIKEAVTSALSVPLETAVVDQVQPLARGITAGLLMLGKARAVEIMSRIGRHVVGLLKPGAVRDVGRIERLADAIVSIEYYMETLQAGRGDPAYMLDNAERCLLVLDAPVPYVDAPSATVGDEAAPREPGFYERTVVLPRAGDGIAPAGVPPAATPDVAAEREPVAAPPEAVVPAPPPPLGVAAEPSAPVELASTPAETPPPHPAEDEFVLIFIEEARDEIGTIERLFPLWADDPGDAGSLQRVRRAYHTLKGSGRMVGAAQVGEFAWAVEQALNRLLDGTLQRSPALLELLRACVAATPRLIDALETGLPAAVDAEALAAQLRDCAEGREPEGAAAIPLAPEDGSAAALAPPSLERPMAVPDLDESAVRRIPPAEPAPPPAAVTDEAGPADGSGADERPDAALQAIYAKEVAGHLQAIRDFIERARGESPPHAVTEALYRACHTLAGASKTAAARHCVRLAEPLHRWLRRLHDHGRGLDAHGLAVLEDAVATFEDLVRNIHEDTGFFVGLKEFARRIEALDGALERELALDAATRIAATESAPPHETPAPDALGPEPELSEPELSEPELSEPELSEPELAAPVVATLEAAPPLDAAAEPVDAFDPAIAAIFCEEATELLEAGEHALAGLRLGRSETGLTDLRRVLHTVKGGARMAGIPAMGDLAHELESLLTLAGGGQASLDGAAYGLVQDCLDELNRMRDLVSGGRSPRAAHGLIARIHRIARGDDARSRTAAPEPGIADAVVPTQPTVAPEEATVEAGSDLVPMALLSTSGDALTAAAQPVAAPGDAAVPEAAEPEPEPEPEPAAGAAEDATLAAAPPEPASAMLPPAEAAAPPPALPGREAPAERTEMARVDADLLDDMLNNAGEVSIFRSRLEQQLTSVEFNLGELGRVVQRFKDQLRKLEIEVEGQILHRHVDMRPQRADFDPLELDRYSTIQQYARALAETASDVASVQQLIETLTREAQNLMTQQGRVVTELQSGLMRTRMVPFQRHVQRLTRIVRQTAADSGKHAELVVSGAAGELDRQVLDRVLPPLEHLLRNAVVHGIEMPAERVLQGKPEPGRIAIDLRREAAEVIITVSDDGAGINLRAVRDKAVAIGLISPRHEISADEALQVILEPGFSTASLVTQAAGRGVGLDVVATEVKKLGGSLRIHTAAGQGTRFTIRLPFTLAISQALIVRVGEELYALPLPTVESIVRIPRSEVQRHLADDAPPLEHGAQQYRVQPLATFIGGSAPVLPEHDVALPVILIRAGEHSAALVVDELQGSREVVVKAVGPQIAGIRGISGATILGDGRICIILDMGALVRSEWRARPVVDPRARERADKRVFALVVDDSITVRRVTQRLLERNGMRVVTARDGLDAVAVLQDHVPDIILLDIEMPRMDGYEVASHVRNDPRLKHIPIVMITSRVGDKHRARAIELGVDDYLGKPYQESQLLEAMEPLIQRRRESMS
jgi:chemosensory pili system protein ChpA (sensor histidine kinase/response regulator)